MATLCGLCKRLATAGEFKDYIYLFIFPLFWITNPNNALQGSKPLQFSNSN